MEHGMPRLCGGISLVLLLQYRKQRTNPREKYAGGNDGLDDTDIFQSLIQVFTPSFNEPYSSSFKKNTSVILAELNSLIDRFNTQIKATNIIANARPQKKNECTRMIWELIYFNLQSQVKTYKDSLQQINADIDAIKIAGTSAKDKVTRLINEIAQLNQQSINTTNAVNSINSLLHDSGFQGFSIQPKKDILNVYEVVREEGQKAVNLSEGEQNFIAFRYFCQQVHESESKVGNIKDKIVVIDAPISNMDSGILFIVSSLTRGMIEIFWNNASLHPESSISTENFIKQIFILTHNTYFHNEITSNMTKYWTVSHFTSSTRLKIKPLSNATLRKSQYLMTLNTKILTPYKMAITHHGFN